MAPPIRPPPPVITALRPSRMNGLSSAIFVLTSLVLPPPDVGADINNGTLVTVVALTHIQNYSELYRALRPSIGRDEVYCQRQAAHALSRRGLLERRGPRRLLGEAHRRVDSVQRLFVQYFELALCECP